MIESWKESQFGQKKKYRSVKSSNWSITSGKLQVVTLYWRCQVKIILTQYGPIINSCIIQHESTAYYLLGDLAKCFLIPWIPRRGPWSFFEYWDNISSSKLSFNRYTVWIKNKEVKMCIMSRSRTQNLSWPDAPVRSTGLSTIVHYYSTAIGCVRLWGGKANGGFGRTRGLALSEGSQLWDRTVTTGS